MNRLLSGIFDLMAIGLLGGGILLFSAEIKLAAAKKAREGSIKLSPLTQKMTGTSLNLSYERVYGK
ncbi:MAG: hypothetical protein GY909_08895 [Oligoflexia bacterium]|nr:hypothetical protein [Oligoflexia bacterium]